MAYSDFTFEQLETGYGLTNVRTQLFDPLPPSRPGMVLASLLQTASQLSIRSEKARSELLVMPVLLDAREKTGGFFTIYSGDMLNADSSRGLNGECDFVLTKDTGSYTISYPIVQVVEAKKNDLEEGLKQCAAQLVGARIFNKKKGLSLPVLYGCATTGNDWQFIKLENSRFTIDTRIYYLSEVGEIIAVFQHIMAYFKTLLP
jgi:hypothetical protein